MEAPVMIDKPNAIPIPTQPYKEQNYTGFPFDDSDFGEGDRDRSFRSHIDDIVKRHPELAEHLSLDRDFDRFPFRSNTWGHKRRGSAGKEDFPGGSAEERRFARPFGSRFDERFGFPFNRTFDREPEFYPPEEPPKQEAEKEKEEKRDEKGSEKPPPVPSDSRRKLNPNVPQSNTVDLGQKQEPVHETRGQRSMSAPPENRSQQRFVSSINIPIQNDNVQQSAPPPQPQPQFQQSKSNERVIPIHVEGRDEPVVPKHNQPFSTTPPQPERAFPSPPQSERVFSGGRPGFGGHWDRREFFPSEQGFYPEQQYYESSGPFFKNREPPQHRTDFGGAYKPQQQQQQQFQRPQQYAHQQQAPPQHQQPPPPQHQQPPPPPHQQPPPPPPQQHPQQQQQQQQQPTAPPPPPPQAPQQPSVPKGPIDQIQFIQKDVLALMDEVEKFNGKPRDKQYLFLDEMLTRNLLKLDNIDTEGKENIRQARKEAIRCIQKCISILEAKAIANEQLRRQVMDAQLDQPAESEPITSLEVSGVARSGSQGSAQQEEKIEESSMDTTAPAEAQASAVEDVEMKPEAPLAEELKAEVPEVKEEQPKEKTEGDKGEKSEAGEKAEATPEPSQSEAKEEPKDKKEKKKVKKKEKPAEQAEK